MAAAISVNPSFSFTFSLLLVVFITFEFQSTTTALYDKPSIKVREICVKCDSPAICDQKLAQDPRTSTTSDLNAVELAVIGMLKSNTSTMLSYINSLIPSFEEPVKGYLSECMNYYSYAMVPLNVVLKRCRGDDYPCLVKNCETARENVNQCAALFNNSTLKPLDGSIKEFADYMCIIKAIPDDIGRKAVP